MHSAFHERGGGDTLETCFEVTRTDAPKLPQDCEKNTPQSNSEVVSWGAHWIRGASSRVAQGRQGASRVAHRIRGAFSWVAPECRLLRWCARTAPRPKRLARGGLPRGAHGSDSRRIEPGPGEPGCFEAGAWSASRRVAQGWLEEGRLGEVGMLPGGLPRGVRVARGGGVSRRVAQGCRGDARRVLQRIWAVSRRGAGVVQGGFSRGAGVFR